MLIISRDDSDCDTMIANPALLTDCREVYNCVNVIAEDIDIFVMLVFHSQSVQHEIHFTAASGTYNFKAVYHSLKDIEQEILLALHSCLHWARYRFLSFRSKFISSKSYV